MNLQIRHTLIPGTRLNRSDMGNVTGMEFLSKLFFVRNGIMLAQIREITGIDGSTLQNWTKRGWVENAHAKQYDMDQVAHILIINMLRDCLRLDQIDFLLRAIHSIRHAVLYDCICRILDHLSEVEACDETVIRSTILSIVTERINTRPEDRERVLHALEIIVTAYYATLIKRRTDGALLALMDEHA